MAIKSANGNKKYKWQLCKNGKQSANSNQELLTKGMCTGWWKSAGWWHLHFISDELCNTFGFMITSGVFALCVCGYSMYIELFLFAQNCFAHSFCWKFPIAICTLLAIFAQLPFALFIAIFAQLLLLHILYIFCTGLIDDIWYCDQSSWLFCIHFAHGFIYIIMVLFWFYFNYLWGLVVI